MIPLDQVQSGGRGQAVGQGVSPGVRCDVGEHGEGVAGSDACDVRRITDHELHLDPGQVEGDITGPGALAHLDDRREAGDVGGDHPVAHAGHSRLELLADRVLEGLDLLAARRSGGAGVAGVERAVVDPVQRRDRCHEGDEDDGTEDGATRQRGRGAIGVVEGPVQDSADDQSDHSGDDQREADHITELAPREVVAPRVRVHADDVHETSVSSSKEPDAPKDCQHISISLLFCQY